MRSDVVIVAHNSGELLAESVASAVDQAGQDHVWVMDVESTDGSVDALRQRRPGVAIVPVPNAGFAAANNRGIERSAAPFVLLLNPDAVLLPGALGSLLATAEASPRAGIVGALVLTPGGEVQAGSFGRFPSLVSTIGLHLARSFRRLRGNLPPTAPGSTKPVDWVTGAAMLVRREAIVDAGPMDEAFFLYYEDTEWCHRMRDHGWEVLLEPRARVVHHLGRSGGGSPAVAQAYRDSFYRYCDLHGLWGLKSVSRAGLWLRSLLGGSP